MKIVKCLFPYLRLYFFIILNVFFMLYIATSYADAYEINFWGAEGLPWYYESRRAYLLLVSVESAFLAICVCLNIMFYMKRKYRPALLWVLLPCFVGEVLTLTIM